MITEIEIDQFQSVFDELSEILNELSYIEPLSEFQQEFAKGEQAAFDGQRSPGGDSWAALSPVTVKRKGHSTILFETGALKASLVTVGGAGNISTVADRGSIFGTSDEKSLWHTLGTSKMPKREHVGTNAETVDKLAITIADFAVKKLKG